MSEQTQVHHSLSRIGSSDVKGFDSLATLALDLRWSWNHATDHVWRKLDRTLWKLTHNAWVVLQSVSRGTLIRAFADPVFAKSVDDLVQDRFDAAQAPKWFQTTHPQSALTVTAFFSMEYMLSEALPIYSGGLGNVAGDQLKAAGDLGVPIVGVGLLYSEGYFRQVIDQEGAQQALFPYNDPGQLPIAPLRQANGEWLRLEVHLPGYSVWLRTWQVHVARDLGVEFGSAFVHPDRSLYRHRTVILNRLGVIGWGAAARELSLSTMMKTAKTRTDPADIINAAVDALIRHRFELPAIIALRRLAGTAHRRVNAEQWNAVFSWDNPV